MTSTELEEALTSFLNVYIDAEKYFNTATEVEERINDATQDLLHVCEFRPDLLDNKNLVSQLHNLRIQRREAKTELEVTKLFWDWVSVKENKKALDTLSNTIGRMRGVLKRQPNYNYIFKTDVMGKNMKSQFLPKLAIQEYEQMEIEYNDNGKTITWSQIQAKEEKEIYAKMIAESRNRR